MQDKMQDIGEITAKFVAYATVWYSKSCVTQETQHQIGPNIENYAFCVNIYLTMR